MGVRLDLGFGFQAVGEGREVWAIREFFKKEKKATLLFGWRELIFLA